MIMQIFKFSLLLWLAALFFFCKPATVEKNEFSFCKDLSEKECLPPVVDDSVHYFFNRVRTDSNYEDFFNDIYFSGDTLSFHLKLTPQKRKQLNQNNIEAVFRFVQLPGEYPIERIRFHKNGVTGFSLIGTILEKRFFDRLRQKYVPIGPVPVQYVIRKIESSEPSSGEATTTENKEKQSSVVVSRTVTIHIEVDES